MDDAADPSSPSRYDVAVVGGGPAGASAAVFTARADLETVVFDRGKAALARAAYLENYLGFPGGIDIGTFDDLLADHLEAVGADRNEETVVAVEPTGADLADDEPRFRVETGDGRVVGADDVIAAAWYDGEYLRPTLGDGAFEEHEHHGELEERFDPEMPDDAGRTDVDGCYVAAPAGSRNAQAVVSAGQGAHVARSLIQDRQRAEGYPEGLLSRRYDWLRPEREFAGEWGERDRWREWFENELPEDHGLDDEELAELRERYIDRAWATRLSDAEIEERRRRGHRRLLEHLDDELVVERAREIEADRGVEDPTQDGGE